MNGGDHMVDDDVPTSGAGKDSASSPSGGSGGVAAAMLSTVSPESALRRSPRLHRGGGDMKTPVRRSAKKLYVFFVNFCFFELHHTVLRFVMRASFAVTLYGHSDSARFMFRKCKLAA